MGPCEHFADRWLDHLYGLLNEQESRELADHLAICPSCQLTQTEVERDQRRMARAARWIRKVPEFQRPDEELTPVVPPEITPNTEVPASVPMPRMGRRSMARQLWPAWAAAAALLIAVLGGWELYRRGADERAQHVTKANKALQDIQAEFASFKSESDAEARQLVGQAKADTLRLFVVGATQTQADAPYTCRVATRDLDGRPVAAELEVRLVRADTGDVIHRQTAASAGSIDVTLPAGLKLEKSVRLEVSAKSGSALATVREVLAVAPATHLVHLAANKAVAQLGEVVFFRALALERYSLKPPAQGIPLRFSLMNSKGKPVAEVNVVTGPGGIASGEFAVLPTMSPGDYTIQVAGADPAVQIQAQARGLEIVERLSDFDVRPDRKLYRPGDKVVLHVDNVRGADGKPLKDAVVRAVAELKNIQGPSFSNRALGQTDAEGRAKILFPIPRSFDGSRIKVTLEVPALQKSPERPDSAPKVIRTITVAPSRLEVDLYPEGGDLIAGVPQRVFFRVRTPGGDEAAPEGKLVLRSDKQGVIFESKTPGEAIGSFAITADTSDTYTLQIPVGKDVLEIKSPFQKLGIKDAGIVMEVANSVHRADEPVRLELRRRGVASKLLLVATCRGQVVGQQFVEADTSRLEMNLPAGAQGVVRLTVYEARGQSLTPLAERLVYRSPAQRLDMKATTKNFKPGQRSQIDVEARDEKGRDEDAWATALVVNEQYHSDQGVLSLPLHFLAGSDFGADLADSALLVRGNPQDAAALELLLGTYGWRRFVTQEAEPAQLAKSAPNLFSVENVTAEQARAQVLAKVDARLQQLQERVDREQARFSELQDTAKTTLAAALTAQNDHQQRPMAYFRAGLGILTIVALLLGNLCIVVGFANAARRRSSTAAFASAFGALGLCLVLYLVGGRLAPIDDGGAVRNQLAGVKPLPPIEIARSLDAGPVQAAAWTGRAALASAPASQATSRTASSLADALAMLEAGDVPRAAVRTNFVDHPDLRQRFEAAQKAQQTPAQSAPGFGREFAHRHQPGFDAQPTLLWHPNLSLDQGRASVAVDVPAADATYRILIYGHDAAGRFGFYEDRITVRANK